MRTIVKGKNVEVPERVRDYTVVQGTVSFPTRMHCPIGSRPGHNTRAMLSLTTPTSGVPARSWAVKGRPRTMRVPIVAK